MILTWLIIFGATTLSSLITMPILRNAGVLGPRRRVVANGLLAQATLVAIAPTSTTVNEVNVVCRLQLRVQLPDRPAYDVETKEPIPIYRLAQMVPGTVLGVRVDSGKPELVFVDWRLPTQPLPAA